MNSIRCFLYLSAFEIKLSSLSTLFCGYLKGFQRSLFRIIDEVMGPGRKGTHVTLGKQQRIFSFCAYSTWAHKRAYS